MQVSEKDGGRRTFAVNAMKIAGFGLLLALILYILSETVFDGKRWFTEGWIINRNARVAALEAEVPETIDVLAVGNSLCVSAFTPMELWKEFGITSFNCALDGANPVECSYVLERALWHQKPAYCLIETDMLFQPNKDMMLREVALKMPIQNLFPMIRYHNVWMTPFQVHPFRKYFKGYLVNGIVDPYTGGPYYSETDAQEEIKPIYLRYFKRMVVICKERGVTPVLFSAPSPDNYNKARHNTLEALAASLDAEYLDLNEDLDSVGIDWQTDTRDGGIHMNQTGAEKVSVYLGRKLAEKGNLEDKRSDPEYSEWEDLVFPYEMTIDEMQDTCYTEMEEKAGIEFW